MAIASHVTTHTRYRTVKVGELSIFYREAGPQDAPAILFLHGLPSSSRMFESLYARLSDRYRLIAPDYPGFGHSDAPNPTSSSKITRTFGAPSGGRSGSIGGNLVSGSLAS